MTKNFPWWRRHERGATTAEYSVGTIGASLMAFWLFRIGGRLGDPNPSWYENFIHDLLAKAFSVPHLFGGSSDWMWRWLM